MTTHIGKYLLFVAHHHYRVVYGGAALADFHEVRDGVWAVGGVTYPTRSMAEQAVGALIEVAHGR